MTNANDKPIGVAVLGLGNVGREVVRIIGESATDLAARVGAPLELRGVAVREVRAHLVLRRETVDDLLSLEVR